MNKKEVMNECIYCKNPLTDNEESLNMNFHAKCAPNIIELAWKLLNKVPE